MTRFTRLPCDGPITAHFGDVDAAHPLTHTGVDIGAPAGTGIFCPAIGTVSLVSTDGQAGWAETFGNSVVLDHGDCFTLYAHMDHPPTFAVGRTVEEGVPLGVVGSTGQSTGPHLHWGMSAHDNPLLQRSGTLLDPLDYMEADVNLTKIVNADAIAALKEAVGTLGGQDGEWLGEASGPGQISVDVLPGYKVIVAMKKEG